MGTYYQVKYSHKNTRNYKAKVDSILVELNQEMSTYIPDSYISLFNRSKGGLPFMMNDKPLQHFEKNYFASLEVFQLSSGAFDPTVMPLVNHWGFGYSPKQEVTQIDSIVIDSILQFVGMEKTLLKELNNQKTLLKTKESVQLDFSAIAKGYAVDVISEYLEEKKVSDYLVEIGGEVRTAGKNARNESWVLGINTPRIDASPGDIQSYVQLSNASMASSGNYRNFYQENGRIISHTINPKTGFPERTNLLAVSVITQECMYADAFATACMVLGLDEGMKLIEKQDNIEACFFYIDEKGEILEKFTNGFIKYLLE
jgi:thiamine biosynthesis lipoprotein